MNILICRLHPWMAEKLALNFKAFGHMVHVIDHKQLAEYKAAKLYTSCYLLPRHLGRVQLETFFKQVLINQHIDLVIIAQILHPYSDAAVAACQTIGIKHVFTERFFDDKLVFDDIGLHYTEKTQCVGISDLPIDWPRKDREKQPPGEFSLDFVKAKYNLHGKERVVVVYGQLLWDMSIIKSPDGMTYDEYIHGLCISNPDTIFLFKPHPKDRRFTQNSSKYRYPNLIRAHESLQTLFKLPVHTAFSSTVIFEGVARGLKFGSVGYHLLRGHTYSIKRNGFNDIYDKIFTYQVDKVKVRRATSYITNIYALRMGDPFLITRLVCGLKQVMNK